MKTTKGIVFFFFFFFLFFLLILMSFTMLLTFQSTMAAQEIKEYNPPSSV
jgi:hypothetical protein